MTIEEKLEHFESLCYGDATERSNKMLADYTAPCVLSWKSIKGMPGVNPTCRWTQRWKKLNTKSTSSYR